MVSHVPGKFSRSYNLLSSRRKNTEPIDWSSERILTASPFEPTLNHSDLSQLAFFIFHLYSSIQDTMLVPHTHLKSILVKTLSDMVLPALKKPETWQHKVTPSQHQSHQLNYSCYIVALDVVHYTFSFRQWTLMIANIFQTTGAFLFFDCDEFLSSLF